MATVSPPAAPTARDPAADVIARFQRPMTELLLDFGDEILDAVRDHARVDVEDVRDKMLGPLRRDMRAPSPPR